MVDFNNETTVTRSQKEIVTFQILEARYNVLEILELYNKQKFQNTIPVSEPALKARIINLFYNIKSSMVSECKEKDKETINKISKNIYSTDINNNIAAFEEIDLFLYNTGILKYYSKRNYNSYNAWEEDDAKGI